MDPAASMQRACDELCSVLGETLGLSYVAALLERALRITSGSFPQLRDVAVKGGSACLLTGLVEGPDDPAAHEAYAAALATFVSLVASFIGEGLTRTLLRRAWPDLPARTLSEDGNE
jgi:hypothetical protein